MGKDRGNLKKSEDTNSTQPTADAIDETSDGYHTFNELYEHRIALFIALMRSHPNISWRAEKHEDDTMFDGWFIAGMHLPTGDISYHLPIEYWRALSSIDHYYHAPTWDGHTPKDVVARLKAWDLPSGNDELAQQDTPGLKAKKGVQKNAKGL